MSKTHLSVDIGQPRPYPIEITRYDAPIRGLPESLHGATFVHLTDLHGGFGNTDAVFEEAIRQVNAIHPDFLFFTGDYIDHRRTTLHYPMETYLSRFESKRGAFGVFGNHDHRRGAVTTRRLLEKSGIRVLLNESVCGAGGLWIAGVDDLFEGEPDIAAAFADVPEDVTSILLSHTPRLIESLGDRDTLQLAGHTHGGQIALPFPPPKLVCWWHLRCWQVAGWYTNGKARLYVNRGLGMTGRPFRYRCPAEIAVFRLVPAEESGQPAREREAVGGR